MNYKVPLRIKNKCLEIRNKRYQSQKAPFNGEIIKRPLHLKKRYIFT